MSKITCLNSFLNTFFTEHGCEILKKDTNMLHVQLTEEMDKVLMNRPFYWHYKKSLGERGEPLSLSLITNMTKKDQIQGEWIHFGSPRLQQIFNYLRERESFVKLFQQVETIYHTPLDPWLLINIKISYRGKQNKNEIFSLGLNLVNGLMKVDMMNLLNSRPLNKSISDYCYPISPIITLTSGYKRIEKVLDQYIEEQSHQWAKEALKAMTDEIQLVEHFYTAKSDEKNHKKKEIEEIKKRLMPIITYKVINGGLIYITQDFNDN